MIILPSLLCLPSSCRLCSPALYKACRPPAPLCALPDHAAGPAHQHYPEQFPSPRILTDIDSNRTPTPPPGPRRAPTPAPRRAPTPAPHCTPTPAPLPDSDDSDSDSDSSRMAKKPLNQIQWPSNANIQTVKLSFKDLYPNLTEREHDKEYMAFRTQLDALCTRYLRLSLALTHQDKNDVHKVYKKLTEIFEWLAEYDNFWPAAVCLQGKLHNSAARAVDKSTRKVFNALAGTLFPDTMVNNRKPVVIRKCSLRTLRSRHYSTSHNAPRFVSTPTNIESDVSRYPLVESNFSDAAHQPWIHDFKIKLQHGKKFNSVVNMHSTDSWVADYIFYAALDHMSKFQSPHRTRLPKELVLKRGRAFPGSP
ncbi:hypothetical protein B0H10DRAFT_2231022 [Mycena sp. CBHHK59/15]|nr:hypothetical protein B0H10DRAFT_2231022 [Mycena sp. CBHHK59/15]